MCTCLINETLEELYLDNETKNDEKELQQAFEEWNSIYSLPLRLTTDKHGVV